MITCASCGAENQESQRFCGECGQELVAVCPSCGATWPAAQKFCGECGTALHGAQVPSPGSSLGAADRIVADELRWASVLFVDLVGSTSVAEDLPAEDVRELLSGYFDRSKTVVARYGGEVEKFIGDAVVAVWGGTKAHEDDAERAVRAALELVDMVEEYGASRSLTLQARAGVVTGQVATHAATDQGLVAGDRVNTAARVQSVAEPGTVLVDETTRRLSEAAVFYVATGGHTLKGKAEPVPLWRAERVVANVGGSSRIDGLETAFRGRARDLAVVKELFHASVEGRRARLVTVIGTAGVGKSRLGWEMEKYLDGLATEVLWHRGRCLPYGEGVALWALAQLVRQRFGIAEDETGAEADRKLREGLPRWVSDEAERAFVLPRLAVLVGAAQVDLTPGELFAGWRLFLERLAQTTPVVWLVEDLHWADNRLLDFIEHLLDWSASSPIFVLTFARPELADRRPDWSSGRPNASIMRLEPLPDDVIAEVLDGLVSDIPAELRARIVKQSAGIPLYAVETIRSLVDRDVVVPAEGRYRVVGEVGELDVPTTLTSLITARLDGLPAPERELVKGLAVLGETFPRAAVSAVSDADESSLDLLLRNLLRREVLAVQSDPLSPEQGQYAFVHGVVRTVAERTLSRRDRKKLHLAVARHLRKTSANDGEEVAQVVASHYFAAYQAAADDADAEGLRHDAAEAFMRAAARSALVGAPDLACEQYQRAADLFDDERKRSDALTAAGGMALSAGRQELAIELYQAVAAEHERSGRHQEAASVAWGIGHALGRLTRLDEGISVLRSAAPHVAPDTADEARLQSELSLLLTYAGHLDEAVEPAERALVVSEALGVPEQMGDALLGKGMLLAAQNRLVEAQSMVSASVEAFRHAELSRKEAMARGNLAHLLTYQDDPTVPEQLHIVAEIGHRAGDWVEFFGLAALAGHEFFVGNWTETERLAARVFDAPSQGSPTLYAHFVLAMLNSIRGDLQVADSHLAVIAEYGGDRDDIQYLAWLDVAEAAINLARGSPDQAAHGAGQAVRRTLEFEGFTSDGIRFGWPLALESALAADSLAELESLLDLVAKAPPGHVGPYLRVQLGRYRALLRAARGEEPGPEDDLRAAVESLSEMGYPYWKARVQADLATWLVGQGRADEAEPLFLAVRETFTELGALPDLDRLSAGEASAVR